jgi:hypothetical protein
MRVRIKGLLNSGDDGKVITNGGKS